MSLEKSRTHSSMLGGLPLECCRKTITE